MSGTDNGFEDREGHQAPFTLPIFDGGFRKADRKARNRTEINPLLNLFDGGDDGVEVRPVAGFEFGMDEFAMRTNFEGAAARRNELEGRDAFAEFEDLGRQTDSLRRVVSDYAVFDRYLDFHVRSFLSRA